MDQRLEAVRLGKLDAYVDHNLRPSRFRGRAALHGANRNGEKNDLDAKGEHHLPSAKTGAVRQAVAKVQISTLSGTSHASHWVIVRLVLRH